MSALKSVRGRVTNYATRLEYGIIGTSSNTSLIAFLIAPVLGRVARHNCGLPRRGRSASPAQEGKEA